MILFCAFDQQMYFIELAKRYGLKNYIKFSFSQKIFRSGFKSKYENSWKL